MVKINAATPKKKDLFLPIILIIVLGFAIYANSLTGEFVWDDDNLVKDNVYIKDWSNVSKILSRNIGAGVGQQYYFYRPIQMLTYMADYFLYASDVEGYHITNILLHILVALCVYWFVNILYGNNILSLFTGLLFVAHPIHTEAVAYISGRADPLVAFFILLCFIFYIKYLDSKNTTLLVLMVASYALALLSRENSIILPAAILLYHYTFKKDLNKKAFLSILGLAFIYILSRVTILKSLLPSSDISFSSTLLQRLPGTFIALANYIKLILFPFGLHMQYGDRLFAFSHPKALLGVIIFFSLLIYAFKKRQSDRIVFFSIFWFFIMLLPVSNIYPIAAYMSEHWLYLPSIGFFMLAASALNHLYKAEHLKRPVIISLAGLLIFYSCLTVRQNNYWKDAEGLYKRTLAYAPNDAALYNNLGNVYNNRKEREKAVSAYKKAIEIDPNHVDAHYNLGTVYHLLKRKEEAMAEYKKTLEINPNHLRALNNLGLIYDSLGRRAEAISTYKRALEIQPDDATVHYNLSLAYFRMKQYGLAVKHCDKAEALGLETMHPDFLKALEPYRKK